MEKPDLDELLLDQAEALLENFHLDNENVVDFLLFKNRDKEGWKAVIIFNENISVSAETEDPVGAVESAIDKYFDFLQPVLH